VCKKGFKGRSRDLCFEELGRRERSVLIGRRLGGASRDRRLLGWRCDHIWCAVFVLNKENRENRENREKVEKEKKCTDWEAPRRRLSRPVLAWLEM
jgi:hypothetical protein